MGWLDKVNPFARKPQTVQRTERRALSFVRDGRGGLHLRVRGFEAANTTRVNQKHWTDAGNHDLDTLLVTRRQKMRNRARYEVRNSGYAEGIVNTYKDDLVGASGPALQILSDHEPFNTKLENDWAEWCKVCDKSGRLHFCDMLAMHVGLLWTCGEYFRQQVTDDSAKGVQLRLLSVHPDRVADPSLSGSTIGDDIRDGVQVDEDGRPVKYFVYKKHPGSLFGSFKLVLEQEEVVARDMLHVLESSEPGQTRGVPWLASVLEIFAQLRDFTTDTLLAARMAAMFAAYIQRNHTSIQLDANDAELSVVDIEPGTLTELPDGTSIGQVKPEHPSTTFPEFKRAMLSEVGRPKGIPYLKVACDASGHNYSSARLDLQQYWRGAQRTQGWLERTDLNPTFAAFFAEWRLLPENAPLYAQALTSQTATEYGPLGFSVDWQWPSIPAIDEAKEEDAVQKALDNGTTNLAIECKRKGRDWKAVKDQRAREQEYDKAIGLMPEPEPEPKPEPGNPAPADDGDGDTETDEGEQ